MAQASAPRQYSIQTHPTHKLTLHTEMIKRCATVY